MEYRNLDGAILINPRDDVATATNYLKSGEIIEIEFSEKVGSIRIKSNIPRGHKFAIKDLHAGSKIRKYGEVIGVAIKDIKAGEHVHNHNLESMRGGV